MKHLGYLTLSKAAKEKLCDNCGRNILVDKTQTRISFEVGSFTDKKGIKRALVKYRYYHMACIHELIDNKAEEMISKPKIRVPAKKLQGKLVAAGLTPEQRTRRHTIQKYLVSHFRDRLIRAYKEQNTEKVFRIQYKISEYIKELESFGPTIELKWLDTWGENLTGPNRELNQLVTKFDGRWQEQLSLWKENKTKWHEMFVRNEQSDYQPNWKSE